MRNCAKQIDLFGVPVRVNFRGDHNYKTRYGTFISLLFLIVVITFTLDQVLKLALFENAQINSHNGFALPDERPQVSLADVKGEFSFAMMNETGGPVQLDPRYGTLHLRAVNISNHGNVTG